MKYNVGKGKSNLSINIIFIIRSSRMITRQTEVINRGLHTFGKFRHALSLCIIMSLITVSLAGCGSNTDFANDASVDMNAYVNATEKIYVPTLPEDVEEAEIFVEAIEGIDEDFIKGVDISSLLVEEDCGVTYKDADGNEEDIMKLLADAGVNCVRIRVWNDPFDEEGHGYGGGNCTAETAAKIGARAAAYGINTCVDFHYSDFWADPNKQMCPKAWKDMTLPEKKSALYDYTLESLKTIVDAGAKVTMVQVGNEINNGIAGERALSNRLDLIKAGVDAVHEFAETNGMDIDAAVHYTSIDDVSGIEKITRDLNNARIDYDVFGVSYYPYWHGTLENMTEVLSNISETYGVKTCVMETAYPYTAEDGDGSGNSIVGDKMTTDYPVSVQGQANSLRDVMAAANLAGAMGVFYWEPAWLPVGSDAGERTNLWEEKGAGWATSYAGAYDPNDAGKYYGGSSWDNQALFDFDGRALASLDVFKYVNHGAVGQTLTIESVEGLDIEVSIGGEPDMPDTLSARYNDTSCDKPINVSWNEEDLAKINTEEAGVYKVKGVGSVDGEDITLEVEATVSVANINYVVNPGFEEDDASMWETIAEKNITDIQLKEADAYSGEKAFHYYDTSDFEFNIQQEIGVLPKGEYKATAFLQGGDMGSLSNVYLYVIIGGDMVMQSDIISLDGWQNWKKAEISNISLNGEDDVTVGVYVAGSGGGWGTMDDFTFCLQ